MGFSSDIADGTVHTPPRLCSEPPVKQATNAARFALERTAMGAIGSLGPRSGNREREVMSVIGLRVTSALGSAVRPAARAPRAAKMPLHGR